MMEKELITQCGDDLYHAMRDFKPLQPLTERLSDITLDDAYYISLQMLKRRLEDDGEVIVGKKIGVTSKVVQDMLGVHQPDFGFLTDAMAYPNGADISVAGNLIQPRAERRIYRGRVLPRPMSWPLPNVLCRVSRLLIRVSKIGIFVFKIRLRIMHPAVCMCSGMRVLILAITIYQT